MKIQIESLSIPAGKENGDYILQRELPNGATLILLADGMGGLSLPESASKIVSLCGASLFGILLVYISDAMLFYTSLGDVSLYYRDKQGEVTQLTNDDTIMQGADTYLTTCIAGRGFRSPIQVQRVPLNMGDSLLLCSDGYYKVHDIPHCFHHKEQTPPTLIDDDSSVVRIEIIQ